MTRPNVVNDEHWGLPYNRTPDRRMDQRGFGGRSRVRGPSPPMVSAVGRRWRAVAIGMTVVASLTACVAVSEAAGEVGRGSQAVADHTLTWLHRGHPGHGSGEVEWGTTSIRTRPSARRAEVP